MLWKFYIVFFFSILCLFIEISGDFELSMPAFLQTLRLFCYLCIMNETPVLYGLPR